tara:strand:- start:216 stop:644 length:429 start_codon:yes stop_codon:yes gene_type:complete
MTTNRDFSIAQQNTKEIAQPPADFAGSYPEYVTYITLLRNNLRPDIDFIYQSRQMGGRVERGGLVLDFSFINPPDLAINVQGVYYHYEQGSVNIAKDLIAREQLASQGVTLIFVDDIDLLENPDYFIREALNYRDHSRIGAG